MEVDTPCVSGHLQHPVRMWTAMITMVTVATEPPGPPNQAQTTGILPVTQFGLGVRTENGRGGAKGSFCSPQKTTHMQGALATLGSPRFLITYKECNYQVWSPSLSPGGSCLSASQAKLPGVPVYLAAGWTDGGPQGPHSVPAGTANPPQRRQLATSQNGTPVCLESAGLLWSTQDS